MKKEIVIVCVSNNAKYIAKYYTANGYTVKGFADNSEKKQGIRINGKGVLSVSEAVMKYIDASFVISIAKYGDMIKHQLLELGVNSERIVVLDTYDIINIKHLMPRYYRCEDSAYIYHNPVEKKEYRKTYFRNLKKCKAYHAYQRNMKLKEYYVSIGAIFKNEGQYLKEWLDYHILVGIEHFFLYNNNSTDNYLDILGKYIDNGIVTLIDWPYNQKQMEAYVDCAERFSSKSNWIGFIDIDEFITPISHDSVGAFLKEYENYGSVLIPWMIFGSSGKEDRCMDDLVIESFTKRWKKHSDVGKCFLNTDYEISKDHIDGLHHFLWTQLEGSIYPPTNAFKRFVLPNFLRTGHVEFPIEIKHYTLKSRQEYMNKMKGTDVYFQENSHTLKAFIFHDEKSIIEDSSMLRYATLIRNT
ncbi:MAG: glycosyltransferase family 92 protein [Lachnospiraceae bacterium]|nr:glycosyltransferase family 92 protein [Lachnospiraceae bacterium]